MSMSRMRRKRRLIKKMEMLGYDFVDAQSFIRETFDLSHATPVGMRFKANAILAPLLEAWIESSNYKSLDRDSKNYGFFSLVFRSRKAANIWMRTTGKLVAENIWKMKI